MLLLNLAWIASCIAGVWFATHSETACMLAFLAGLRFKPNDHDKSFRR